MNWRAPVSGSDKPIPSRSSIMDRRDNAHWPPMPRSVAKHAAPDYALRATSPTAAAQIAMPRIAKASSFSPNNT